MEAQATGAAVGMARENEKAVRALPAVAMLLAGLGLMGPAMRRRAHI